MKEASPESVGQWVGMAGRLDQIGLRELEAQLRRDWSAHSLGPVLAAIDERREYLSQARDYPTCAYCGKPCDKPFGWFAVERWEAGQVARRGYACSSGCLIATAHSQRDRASESVPTTKGLLQPVEE